MMRWCRLPPLASSMIRHTFAFSYHHTYRQAAHAHVMKRPNREKQKGNSMLVFDALVQVALLGQLHVQAHICFLLSSHTQTSHAQLMK